MHTNRQGVPSDITKYVAGKMTALRTERRWSQEEVACNGDLHHNQIGRMERGDVCVRLDTMTRITKAFGMSMAEFFKDYKGS